MTAIWKTMHGTAGLPGWRWVSRQLPKHDENVGLTSMSLSEFYHLRYHHPSRCSIWLCLFPRPSRDHEGLLSSARGESTSSESLTAQESRGPQDWSFLDQASPTYFELVSFPYQAYYIGHQLTWLSSWIFTMFWILGGALEAFTTQSCMVLWMKASKQFTVPQNNDYPLGITAIGPYSLSYRHTSVVVTVY